MTAYLDAIDGKIGYYAGAIGAAEPPGGRPGPPRPAGAAAPR